MMVAALLLACPVSIISENPIAAARLKIDNEILGFVTFINFGADIFLVGRPSPDLSLDRERRSLLPRKKVRRSLVISHVL